MMSYKFLRWVRAVLGLTQSQLASKSGYSLSYIKRIELGHFGEAIPKPTAAKLKTALGKSDEELDRYKELFDEQQRTIAELSQR